MDIKRKQIKETGLSAWWLYFIIMFILCIIFIFNVSYFFQHLDSTTKQTRFNVSIMCLFYVVLYGKWVKKLWSKKQMSQNL